MNNKYISGGYNNTAVGHQGTTGHQGTAGPAGYQITDWKDELMKKYPHFKIKIEYDVMTPHNGKPFSPSNTITDKRTNKEYTFRPHTTDIVNETEQFIQRLIITIRDEKINTIFNEPKD